MAFAEDTIRQAWNQAGEKCEGDDCGKNLEWGLRGIQWEAHHTHSVAAGGHDGVSNCKILCNSCHQKTSTYGG